MKNLKTKNYRGIEKLVKSGKISEILAQTSEEAFENFEKASWEDGSATALDKTRLTALTLRNKRNEALKQFSALNNYIVDLKRFFEALESYENNRNPRALASEMKQIRKMQG